jgi:hypothetical protein
MFPSRVHDTYRGVRYTTQLAVYIARAAGSLSKARDVDRSIICARSSCGSAICTRFAGTVMGPVCSRLARARMLPVAVVAAWALLGVSGVACTRRVTYRAHQTPRARVSATSTAQRSASQAEAARRRGQEASISAVRQPDEPPKPGLGPSELDIAPSRPPVETTGGTGTSSATPGTTSLIGSSSVVTTPGAAARISSDPWRSSNSQPAAGRTSGPAGRYGRLFAGLVVLLAAAVTVLWLVTRRPKRHTTT